MSRPSAMARRPDALLAALLCALALTGCVEAEETWDLASDGSGTYALVVRWNADLRGRIVAVVGEEVAARFEGRPFPLDAAAWRDGLGGLHGVEVVRLEQTERGGGVQEIALEARFDRIEALLGWEVLARRTLHVGLVDEAGEPVAREKAEAGDRARLEMHPLARVPLLDPLAQALEAREKPELASAPGDDPEPGLLERMGVRPHEAELVLRILAPRLAAVRITFRLRVPGRVLTVADRAVEGAVHEAEAVFGMAQLRDGGDRRVALTWKPLLFDRVPAVRHEGDAAWDVVGGQ